MGAVENTETSFLPDVGLGLKVEPAVQVLIGLKLPL
jgi:hypothetical protein